MSLSPAERLKFRLIAEGLTITRAAGELLTELNGGRRLTPADFASTSGVILLLDDDVWVNAPISDHNPNFVHEPPYALDSTGDGFVVHGDSLESKAKFWLSPAYHESVNARGRPYNYYVFTHGDRVRLSPIQGCSMRCQFCNVPYEDKYATKDVDDMMEALGRAVSDPVQPAQHVLISGGTPAERDIAYLRDVYERALHEFPNTDIDIMMVPVEGLLDIERLSSLGVHELSINIELHDSSRALSLMRQKYMHGLDQYLEFIEAASDVLGPGRVRSMLMVGLEPTDETLAGVKAIAERGGIPVLSPFRPDPATPLRGLSPPTAAEMEEAYLRADEVARGAGAYLGPACLPCTHNTMTLASSHPDGLRYRYPVPTMV